MRIKLGFNQAIIRHEFATPTFAFTILGLLCLALHNRTAAGKHMGLDAPAFVLLSLAGVGGCAMAIAGEVRDKGNTWDWNGIVRSLARPSRTFKVAFGSHLGQALVAGVIAATWRHNAARKTIR